MPATAARARQAVTGAAIAATALRYTGQGYVFGGNASRPGEWDCSSFVSYVLGHDLGLALPGGQWGAPGFPPAAHGPVVTDYAAWGATVAVPPGQETAGDLVCWVGVGAGGHIGIVLAANKMVSALNPQLGTLVTAITGAGPLGVPIVYRRLAGVTPGGVLGSAAGAPGGGTTLALLLGLALVAGLAAVVIGATVLAGAGTVLAARAAWRAGQGA